ncbi:MAG: ThuA domain-containing protein [Lewinellaceae bacterium]|nr:ThuA domain-containing protein [Lewinellaceae bacterium]
MTKYFLPGLLAAVLLMQACNAPEPERILVFSKTAGPRHAAIEAGREALAQMAEANHWLIDTTENAELIAEENLQRYSAVVFLNTSGAFLNSFQQADLQRYIQAGGGFAGIHSACETEPDWAWFGELIGARPDRHETSAASGIQVIRDVKHPAIAKIPDGFSWTDEWYHFPELNAGAALLCTREDENKSVQPVSWFREFDGGRSFYTCVGHNPENFRDPVFLEHLKGGIQYAIGNNVRDYSKATTSRTPDEDRFVKVPLADSVWVEPIELSVLPNLDILVIQRRGELMYYRNDTRELTQAGKLDVFFQADDPKIHSEQGLVGLTIDPEFADNHFIYLFYSPKEKEVNRLSRFTLVEQTLDLASEKILLEFYSDRSICCHTGGSLAFGPDRMLFVSTGDNTAPTHQRKEKNHPDGFAPIDNRPEFKQFDATGKAGNTNDYQGKILRLKINPDGTYEIPDGNLFPKGEAGTLPEVYVMGTRNPYRISVDWKSGFLYWGEVGPDAEEDNEQWGPEGYDEINQARGPGNFGWPFFIADNKAYREYDFATDKAGAYFDPLHPVNTSKRNTGKRELPPAQGAFIWYPYEESTLFPQLGAGGRNAMAGPVYHAADYPEATRLPAAYDGKLFIYEWMRDWVKVVTMDSTGNYVRMEPFMSGSKFSHPIDMEIGPDGRLYVLEYGAGWYTGNDDSGLYRIDFTDGNRPPKAKLVADRTSGSVPLTVKFSAAGSLDPDGGPLSYIWDFGDGQTEETTAAEPAHTYAKVGDYNVFLTAIDDKGAATRIGPLAVYAGNEAPRLAIEVEGNRQFYFPGRPVKYKVVVADKEDGQLEGAAIPADRFSLKLDYLTVAKPVLGHQIVSEDELGRQYIGENDCASCHKEKERSAGPSYEEVAARYRDQKDAIDYLSAKIIKGGSGVWGETAMSAHPSMTVETAGMIAGYILTLGRDDTKLISLPAAGDLNPDQGKKTDPKTVVRLKASYTDKGGPSVRAMASTASLELSYPKIEAEGSARKQHMTEEIWQKETLAKTAGTEGWMSYPACDFTGVNRLKVRYALSGGKSTGFQLRFYLDSPDGTPVATTTVGAGEAAGRFYEKQVDFKAPADGKPHSLYVKYQAPAGEKAGLGIDGYLLED